MRTLAILLCCCAIAVAEQPRVFVTDSQSWEMSGSGGGANGAWGSHASGGARPQTAEVIKTFGEKCKEVVINNKRDKADYVVVLDHEGGKGWARKNNKVAVFNFDGDAILSRSTRSLGSSVDEGCKAILKDWTAKGSKRPEPAPEPKPAAATPVASPAPELVGAKVSIASQPAGADIEVDGAFVGSTPSTIVLTPGEHTVDVKKNGYKEWERKVKITGGDISLATELEKKQ